MATFRNGKMPGESIQVASVAGYLIGSLLSGIVRLAGKGAAGAVTAIGNRREDVLFESHEDMRASNDLLCVNVLGNYVDNKAKRVQIFLNESYDDVIPLRHLVPVDVWDTCYRDLYLQSFNDIKAFRDWHCRVHDVMVQQSSTIMNGNLNFMRQNWLNPSTARLNTLLTRVSERYELIDRQAASISYKTKPFRT